MWVAGLTYSLANGFFQSTFKANEIFCLLNKFVLFANQKQLLKCVPQKSYLDLSYNLYIIWQGVHFLVILQVGGTKKHCRASIFDERLPVTIYALNYDHDIITIRSTGRLKLFWYEEVAGRWIEIKIC